MTTIEEQSGTLGGLIDDWAEGLLAFDTWSDADPEIDNSGTDDQGESTNDWRSNARVLEHAPSGSYFLLYLLTYAQSSEGDGDDSLRSMNNSYVSGARLIHSTDWDTENNSPAGKTTATDGDPMGSLVENTANYSYNYNSTESYDYEANGLLVYDRNDSEYEFVRNRPVVYYGSTNADGFAFGAWGTNSTNVVASWMHFEHIDTKFWDDGELPTVLGFGESDSNPATRVAYGFEAAYSQLYDEDGSQLQALFGYDGDAGAVEDADWGFVNPNADDDTFFFRRPVIYMSRSKNYPVGFIRDVIPNHITEGGAHGDIITHNGTDYRIFRQGGSGTDNTISVGLRYE